MTIATDAFDDLLTLEAEHRGAPGLASVTVPHPIGGLKPAAVQLKAEPVADALLAALIATE